MQQIKKKALWFNIVAFGYVFIVFFEYFSNSMDAGLIYLGWSIAFSILLIKTTVVLCKNRAKSKDQYKLYLSLHSVIAFVMWSSIIFINEGQIFDYRYFSFLNWFWNIETAINIFVTHMAALFIFCVVLYYFIQLKVRHMFVVTNSEIIARILIECGVFVFEVSDFYDAPLSLLITPSEVEKDIDDDKKVFYNKLDIVHHQKLSDLHLIRKLEFEPPHIN